MKEKENIEEELKRTEKSIEAIKKSLLSGSNQKKLSAAENSLSEKRAELEKKYNEALERNESRKEEVNIQIAQLERMAIILRERLALLKEEYDRLREISRDTADRIVQLETGTLCSDETGKELNTELKAIREAICDLKTEARNMRIDLSSTENDISRQRAQLAVLEKYKPRPVETDVEYIRLEKELAYRTARRDYLAEKYSQGLKTLDELNCRLYTISMADRRKAEFKNMA